MRVIKKNFFCAAFIGMFAAVLIGCSDQTEQRNSEAYVDTSSTEEIPTETETETESEVVVSESVREAFQRLVQIEDPAEFDEEYGKLKVSLKEEKHEEEWDILLRDVSEYYDYLQNEKLTGMVSEYSLINGKNSAKYLDLERIAALVGEDFGKNFMDKLYVEGCIPRLSPILWRQEDLYDYCGFGSALDMLMISADELVVPDADPQPRTALLVDASEAIYIEGMGLLPMSDVDNSEIVSRAQKIYHALRRASKNRLVFTGNPALADLIITVKVTYPVCGTYWGGKQNVLVFGCRVNGTVRQISNGKRTSFRAISEPDWKVDAEEGVDTFWMPFPQMIDEYDFKKGVRDALSWYDVVIDIGPPPYEPEEPQSSEQTEDTESTEDTKKKKKKKKKKETQNTEDTEGMEDIGNPPEPENTENPEETEGGGEPGGSEMTDGTERTEDSEEPEAIGTDVLSRKNT